MARLDKERLKSTTSTVIISEGNFQRISYLCDKHPVVTGVYRDFSYIRGCDIGQHADIYGSISNCILGQKHVCASNAAHEIIGVNCARGCPETRMKLVGTITITSKGADYAVGEILVVSFFFSFLISSAGNTCYRTIHPRPLQDNKPLKRIGNLRT